jgi:hypothetical protein
VRKPLLIVLGLLFVLLLAAGAGGLWRIRGVHKHREARIVTLEADLPVLRQADPLDADTACALLEHHLLTRDIDRALAVDCKAAKLDATGRGVVRLAGPVYASSVDNAILGGGFGTPHCLAMTAEGWAVVGQAWRLDECAFDADPEAAAQAVAEGAGRQVADQRRAVAEVAISAVRRALTEAPADLPAVCGALEPASGQAVALVDTQVWSEAGLEGFWRSVITPTFTACVEDEPPTQYSLGCGLMEPWHYVLALEPSTKVPPSMVGTDEFTGGHYRATLLLVDMTEPRVICARPVALSLEGTVVLGKSDWIVNHYHQRIKATLCDEVEALTGGQLALDPYWGC